MHIVNDYLRPIKISAWLLIIIWSIFLFDFITPFDLTSLGVYPRTISGLKGILFAPLLHASFSHILYNSLPLFTLTIFLLIAHKRDAFGLLLIMAIGSSALVWLIGRSAHHVGASSLIYAEAAFLITFGIVSRQLKSIIIALAVIFLYSGLIWGIFPSYWYVSWEGHLSGAIIGITTAKLLIKK